MSVKTFAAIDVGSFEISLKIVAFSGKNSSKVVEHIRKRIDLGGDTYVTGKINAERLDELCRTLKEFSGIMKTYKVADYKAYGTSAIREAENSNIILDHIEQRTGIKIEVLSNSEQRFLHYKAIAFTGESFQNVIYLIEREMKYAKEGKKAHIIAKMNSLCDKDVIEALYRAGAAGVKIELIIRGICCLKVGIPGVSENITVRSIVGNFLEHSRIFYFENDGQYEIYCSSADWMPRNLERRVEILFPIEAKDLKEQVCKILEYQLKDNLKAHILQPDGSYEKIDKRGKVLFGAQATFCEEAVALAEAAKEKNVQDCRVFIPERQTE